MSMYASSSDTFYKYYAARQRGGALASVDGIPVFRASRRTNQGGAGLGDVLRSAFRWFLPVALRGASAFANAFLKSHDQGASYSDAAKSAIAPTLSVAARAFRRRMAAKESRQQAATEEAAAAPTEQAGTGRKRRHRRVYKGRAKRSKKTKKSTTKKRKQVGLGRRKRKSKKAKKQLGGRRNKARKTSKTSKKRRRRSRATTSPSISSYNF